MKTTIRHGAVVSCDVPKCDAKFTTYSVSTIAREQAGGAGWSRLKLGEMPGWEDFGLGSKKSKKLDVCPGCKPKPRMDRSAEVAAP